MKKLLVLMVAASFALAACDTGTNESATVETGTTTETPVTGTDTGATATPAP